MDIIAKKTRLREAMAKAGFWTEHDEMDHHLEYIHQHKPTVFPTIGIMAEKVGHGEGFLGVTEASIVFARRAGAAHKGMLIEFPRQKGTEIRILLGGAHDNGGSLGLAVSVPGKRFWQPRTSGVFTGHWSDVQKFIKYAAVSPQP